jgi:hypothetical protein
MGVLHDGEDSLTVTATATKAIKEIGQSVLMESTSYEDAGDDGE